MRFLERKLQRISEDLRADGRYDKFLKNLHFRLFDRMIHQKNEPPLISTYLRSPNVQELLYSIFFLLLVTGYLVTHFLIFCRAFIKLQTELEKVKYLMIPSYMIELQKLLDRYPPHKQNSFGLTDLFLVALEKIWDFGNMLWGGGPAYGVKSIRSTNNFWN